MRHAVLAFATALIVAASPAHALGPSWSYLEGQFVWAHPQLDERGTGWNIHAATPIDDTFYLVGFGEQIHARYEGIDVNERFSLASLALGAHVGSGSLHVYGQLHYADKTRTRYELGTKTSDHGAGVGGSVGARWLPWSWLSVEPQTGIKGFVIDGFTKLDIAVKVMPHLWVVGTFHHGLFSGNEYDAGLRWSFNDYTYGPDELPSARVLGRRAHDLKVGDRMAALRRMIPQQRPAGGSAELAPIKEGTEFTLEEAATTRFGTWWRIGEGAWIREEELLGKAD